MIKLNEIFAYLDQTKINYEFLGKQDLVLTGFSPIDKLKPNTISWIKDQSYFEEEILKDQRNILLVVKSNIAIHEPYLNRMAFILCENPKEIFFSILASFFPAEQCGAFKAPSAVVEGEVGRNVYIGHHTYIGPEVRLGDNVVVKNNVSIEGKVVVGKNTIIHSGVAIGTDGYGYYQDEAGRNIKVPHYGGVIIGENVEIGANTSIERGTLDNTIIGNNVKIDDLCHIGHNSAVCDNCSIVALSMLGGSTYLEPNVYVAPGVMVRNQLKIGENSLLGMGAVVVKNVEANKVVAGVPAKIIREK